MCSTLYGTCSVSGLVGPLSIPDQGNRNVQAMLQHARQRLTIVAVRCDTSEETRAAIHVKHLAGCLAGLEELPLGDGPFKCPGQWRFGSDNRRDKIMQTGKVVKTR